MERHVLNNLAGVLVLLLLQLFTLSAAHSENVRFKERFLERPATSDLLEPSKSGSFSLTARMRIADADVDAFSAATPVRVNLGSFTFSSTMAEGGFRSHKRKVRFTVFEERSDNGQPKQLQLVLSWTSKILTLKVVGATAPSKQAVFAGEFDGLSSRRISIVRQGSFSAGEFQRIFDLSVTGKVETQAFSGPQEPPESLSKITLKGKGAYQPQVLITEPTDNFLAIGNSVTVRGRVDHLPDDATIELNGEKGSVDPNGHFEFTSVYLFDGENDLTVRAHSKQKLVTEDRLTVFWDAPADAKGIITSLGGVVTVTDASSAMLGASVRFEPNSVSRDLTLSIQEEDEHVPALPFGVRAVGPAMTFGPVGASFSGQATLTLPYTPTLLPANSTPDKIEVFAMSDSGWVSIPVVRRLESAVEVRVSNFQFSPIVAVAMEPVGTGELRLTSEPSGATIYIDGMNTWQETPAILHSVSSGTRRLKLYIPEYNEVLHDVKVPEEGIAVHVDLNRSSGHSPLVELLPGEPEHATVTAQTVALTGKVALPDSASVEGTLVIDRCGEDLIFPIASNGTFSTEVSLLPGDNVLTARFTSSDGRTGVSRTLRRTKIHSGISQPVTILQTHNPARYPGVTVTGFSRSISVSTGIHNLSGHWSSPRQQRSSTESTLFDDNLSSRTTGGGADLLVSTALRSLLHSNGKLGFSFSHFSTSTLRIAGPGYTSVESERLCRDYFEFNLERRMPFKLSVAQTTGSGLQILWIRRNGNYLFYPQRESIDTSGVLEPGAYTVELLTGMRPVIGGGGWAPIDETYTNTQTVRFEVGALDAEIVIDRLETHNPAQPQRNAIFTTLTTENQVRVYVTAPAEIPDSELRLKVERVDPIYGRMPMGGTSAVRFVNRQAVVDLSIVEDYDPYEWQWESSPLEYRFVVETEDDSLRSLPATLKQDRLSTIRQEYADKARRDALFRISAPVRGSFHKSLPAGDHYFSFQDFAGRSDYSPAPAIIGRSAEFANRIQEAWDSTGIHKLRVTSGWRNPRRNDRVGGESNSWHQTGDAVDMNPPQSSTAYPITLLLQGKPVTVTTYREAQDALRKLAEEVLGAECEILLHGKGANLHLHVEPVGAP